LNNILPVSSMEDFRDGYRIEDFSDAQGNVDYSSLIEA
jgi:hypothetical protein